MTGSSIEAMQAMRRLGTDAQPTTAQRNRTSKPSMHSKSGPKALEDKTVLLDLFRRKYLGDEKGTVIEITAVEALLSDIRAHQEAEEEKQRRREAASGGASGVVRSKPLRKERLHRSAKFSLLQLLSVLEAGLNQEEVAIRFDYVSMHTRCLRVLKAAEASAHDYLVSKHGPDYLGKDYELAWVVGWILWVSTLSGRAADQVGIKREKLEDKGTFVRSKVLVKVTEVLKAFLNDPDEAAAELSRISLS